MFLVKFPLIRELVNGTAMKADERIVDQSMKGERRKTRLRQGRN